MILLSKTGHHSELERCAQESGITAEERMWQQAHEGVVELLVGQVVRGAPTAVHSRNRSRGVHR